MVQWLGLHAFIVDSTRNLAKKKKKEMVKVARY